MTSFVEARSTTFHHNGRPSKPHISLASHCVRMTLGESVEKVVDALAADDAGMTWTQLLGQLRRRSASTTAVIFARTKRQRQRDLAHLRAALLVLWQHSIVTIRIPTTSIGQKVRAPVYTLQPQRAIYLGGPRYAKALELVKKALDGTAAAVMETLLCRGKARTVDIMKWTIQDHFSSTDENNEDGESDTAEDTAAGEVTIPKHDRHTPRETVINALVKLVQGGFLETVALLARPTDDEDDDVEFGEQPPTKKVKIEEKKPAVDEDPALMAILDRNAHYKALLPPDTVWRVHWDMIHASLRAVSLGRLVNEVHGHRVQSAGSYLSAALRYRAAVRYGPAAQAYENNNTNPSSGALFGPEDIAKFLPKPVHQNLEKKTGGVTQNLRKALLEMSKITASPRVVRRVSEDLFEVRQNDLLEYWKKRVIHQLISDRHGAVAARIVSILLEKGWLEADTLAQYTMVPVKDTRAILHILYESGYVEVFPLYTAGGAKQQNPSNAIYLWKVETARLGRVVREQISLATLNLRLRRQHQVEEGKTFIERAQQETDENENETDKLNYQKFCSGLERIDVALQQLDETAMVLSDF
eukprot:scaffold992_cov175-Amphora_coffeaeformis.AAC.6